MSKKPSTNLCTGPSLRIGVLGGGQLGRMMIQAAIDLDMRVEVMDSSADAPCSTLTHRFVCGDLNDANAVFEFGKELDVITIEIENVIGLVGGIGYFRNGGLHAKRHLVLSNARLNFRVIEALGLPILQLAENVQLISAVLEIHPGGIVEVKHGIFP